MNANPGWKACPRCGLAAPLAAPTCAGCGRVYRTQFGPAPPAPSPALAPLPARRPFGPWLPIAVLSLLVPVIGFVVVSAASKHSTEQALLGVWRHKDGWQVAFQADHTYQADFISFDDRAGRWEVSGSRLHMQFRWRDDRSKYINPGWHTAVARYQFQLADHGEELRLVNEARTNLTDVMVFRRQW